MKYIIAILSFISATAFAGIPVPQEECVALGAQAAKYAWYKENGASRTEVENAVIRYYKGDTPYKAKHFCDASFFAVEEAYTRTEDYSTIGMEVYNYCVKNKGFIAYEAPACASLFEVKGEF